jgi:hypothetical protein
MSTLANRLALVGALAVATAPLPGCLLLAGVAIGAGIVYMVGDDSAEVALHKDREAVFEACRDEVKARGTVDKADASTGDIEGKVGSSSVRISVRSEESKGGEKTVKVTVISRKNSGISPDPDTARIVAEGISKRAGG